MTRRYETGKWVPAPDSEAARYIVPLNDLQAAADRLEVAAVAHADAQRRGEERHAAVTGEQLARARAEFLALAERACTGTDRLRTLLRGVYDHMLTHHGRRLACRLRPWLR